MESPFKNHSSVVMYLEPYLNSFTKNYQNISYRFRNIICEILLFRFLVFKIEHHSNFLSK